MRARTFALFRDYIIPSEPLAYFICILLKGIMASLIINCKLNVCIIT